MSTAAVIAIALGAVVVLAAISFFTMARRPSTDGFALGLSAIHVKPV